MPKFIIFFGIIFAVSHPRAQTASELVAEIERVYLSGEAVTATFNLGRENNIALTASLTSAKYLYETSTEKIVNDGITISNYNKKLKQVTISDVTPNAQSTGVQTQDFFHFSSNYYPAIVKSKKHTYSLELTPKESLKKLFEQAGITSLIIDLTRSPKQKTVKITSILANATGIKRRAGNVKITPIQKAAPNLFTFSIPKGVKVVDLRD